MEPTQSKTCVSSATPSTYSTLLSPCLWFAVSVIATSAVITVLILPYPYKHSSEESPPLPSPPLPSPPPPPPEQKPLVIAVLSARNNFELRRAIRETWLEDIRRSHNLKNRVVVKFILGNHDCPLSPLDRIHDCLPRLDAESRLPFQSRSHYALRSSKENQLYSPSPPSSSSRLRKREFCGDRELQIQVDIHVLETILIDQLGLPYFGRPTRITLHDYSSTLTVVTTESPNRHQTLNAGNTNRYSINSFEFVYIPIKPLALEKGFRGYFLLNFDVHESVEDNETVMEGEAEFEAADDEICISWTSYSSHHGLNLNSTLYSFDNAAGRLFYFPRVILRRQRDDFDDVAASMPFDAAGTNLGFVSFRFRLLDESVEEEGQEEEMGEEVDKETVEQGLDSERARKVGTNWLETKNEETLRIERESAEFGDLLFVDVIDTYANLPTKLLKAIKSLSQIYHLKFLLKTDDDVYLKVEAIHDVLQDHGVLLEDDFTHGDESEDHLSSKSTESISDKKIYLGRFRRDWAVMRSGKWAETSFQGNGYPPFACGATYGLSGAAVSWLASNAASLGRYQGEDVSMGFWMAAFGAEVVDDVRFACGKDESVGEVDGQLESCGVNVAELSPVKIRREHKTLHGSAELKSKLWKKPGL